MAGPLVNVDVDDLERGIAFYVRAFGLRVSRRFPGAAELEGGPSPIYLLEKAAGSPPFPGSARERDYARHWTPVHLDFVVHDLEGAVERATRAGARHEGGIAVHAWGRMATMADPWGHGFCLLQFTGRGYDEIAETTGGSGAGAPSLRPSTLAAQALGWWDPSTRALVPAIHPSTTYERASDGSYPGGRGYTRDENPTYEQAEALLASLEGGEAALLFASGMAAAAAVLDSLEPGAHVVAGERMYWALRSFLERIAREGRIRLDLVPSGDLGALARAMRRGETRLVWVETPANPTCEVTDLEAAAAIAQSMGAAIAVDSTVATPVHTRPIALGCDLVFHSATKQLNGHSDVLAGALVCARRDELWTRIRGERASRGAVLGPFEAWLLLRGMRTLYLRGPAASRGAQRVAEALEAHPGVAQVFYPGLTTHPAHDIAARQMRGGFGCMLSFRVRAGEAEARAVAGRTRVIKQATSLGGVESLIEHRASIEGPASGLPGDLLRLSIGIEEPEDLVADLEQALA